ncbi:MAG: BREX-1 system phosphatase PglZ type A, partial [Christensenellaceae bacterium]
PAIRDNHLADTIHYSKEFFADRASLLTLDLGIDERYKSVIQHYIKFFSAKDRTQKFYDLEIESFNRSTIEIALMCVICKSKTASFEDVVRCILTDDGLENNKYLAEFDKYDLLPVFWQHCELVFAYTDTKPTLEKFVMTLFVTYASKSIHENLPQAWKAFYSYKSGNIIAFLDNLMNSYLYGERFDEISAIIWNGLNASSYLSKMPPEAIADCNLFSGIDTLLIKWMIDRLESEDIDAKLNGVDIPKLCYNRRKKHFGRVFKSEYFVLENAYNIISGSGYSPISTADKIVKFYTDEGYKIDRYYRYFYYYFDKLENGASFEKLRELVENIYTNDYLDKMAVNWSSEFASVHGETQIAKQTDFFGKYVRYAKERVVVIISDAMRYEVGRTLFEKLQGDEKCTVSIAPMQSVLPAITRVGMAALLPHKELCIDDKLAANVDGLPCVDTKQREAILKNAKPNSRCIQCNDLKGMKISDLREIFTGQDVVYIYHNSIDDRGEHNAESEIFNACEEAVEEIFALIKRLSTSANTVHFIVTADHGFIYKRDKLSEGDKISGVANASRRYLISNETVNIEGVAGVPLSIYTDRNDTRTVYYPIGTDLFKAPGSGQNYVHGGCSVQEMIIPVIDVKTEKGRKETSAAEITLVSLVSKITNLITTLDFLQTEPISDVVKETEYRIYFISDDNEKISNENIFIADKKDTETAKRMFRMRFSFKNKKYDKNRKYYLVAYDNKNDLEIMRHEILMDIAFADDFGFDL